MRALFLVAIATSLSCASPAPLPVPIPKLATTTTASASATPAPPAASREVELARLLCDARVPCVVRRDRAAGAGLHVVSLDLGVKSVADEAQPPVLQEPADDLKETPTGDSISPIATQTSCRQLEYWLVNDALPARPKQLLEAVCNDGHGAAGIGEAGVEISDGRFEFDISGGSSWRWQTGTKVGLAPLRLLETSWENGWTLGPNLDKGSFDFTTFVGRVEWFSPACDANGEPPRGDWADPAPFEYLLVPEVALDEAYRRGGWKTTSLGACAIDLDGTGDHGFLLSGKAGKRADASIRAVVSTKGTLYVEVRDTTPTGATARWTLDDHIEIWMGTDAPSYMDHCLDHGRSAPMQWGVRVVDGKVFAGYGAPNVGLNVARVAVNDVVRFAIDLLPSTPAFTIAYSDGGGGKQARLFATSHAKRGAPESLGARYAVSEKRATCETRSGKLEPRPVAPADPESAFIE